MSQIVGSSDPLVVYTRDFAPHLEAYINANEPFSDPDLDVPENLRAGFYVSEGGQMAGPVDVLSDESEVDPRRIFAFRHCEQNCLTFRVFDKLITAMGMPNLAWEIPVYRNPVWSVRKFMAWLDEQGMTAEELGVNVELAQPVPWRVIGE